MTTNPMGKYKVGDHLQVKLSGGRIVEATIKAIVDTTEGMSGRLLKRVANQGGGVLCFTADLRRSTRQSKSWTSLVL